MNFNYADHIDKLNELHAACCDQGVMGYRVVFEESPRTWYVTIDNHSRNFVGKSRGDLGMALEEAIMFLKG